MRAILIIPEENLVSEIYLSAGLQPVYDALQCTSFHLPDQISLLTGHDLYLDQHAGTWDRGFEIGKDGVVFSGRGLILGLNSDTRDSVAAMLDLEEVRAMIDFPRVYNAFSAFF